MKLKKARTAVICLLIAAVVLLLLPSGSPSVQTPALTGQATPHTAALLRALPDYHLEVPDSAHFRNLYSASAHGIPAACLDVQALPAVAEHLAGEFEPHCLATVVLAVDRSQTDWIPTGWQDLSGCGVSVSFADHDPIRCAVLASIAYALEGEEYTKYSALRYLEALHAQGILSCGDPDAPITICFDDEAVAMMKAGRNLEIVVPAEGTLTFARGLLLREAFPHQIPDDILLESGLRLLSGECDGRFYPDAEAYSGAGRVSDPDRFLTVTENTVRDLRRSVFHVRLISSADGREHILMFQATLILIMIWSSTALYRSSKPEVCRWVLTVTGLTTGWILLSIFKFQLPANFLNRICWYAYYIFLMGLPLTMLRIASVLNRPDCENQAPCWFHWIALPYPFLVLLVFTNDFHQFVFQFDLNSAWFSDYTYGIGYLIIFAYCILTFLLSIVILLLRGRHSPRRFGWIGPVVTALLLVGYNLGYALGIRFIRETSLTIFFCLLSVLFMESVLGAGLIPSNTHYMDLFSASPLHMQLLDSSGNTALSSANSRPLTSEQRSSILENPGICLQKDSDTMLYTGVIPGGYAVWEKDLSASNRLNREIAASVQQLRAANALLRREREIQKQKIASEVKARLSDQLEQDIAEKSRALSDAVRDLPENPQERERRISYITLLLCHIKRRSNLFFVSQENSRMAGVELAVYLDELSEFALYAGIHALVRSGELGRIDVRAATLCYDFYFSMLSWAICRSRATLIGRLEQTEAGLSFRILASEPIDAPDFSDSFRRRADGLHAEITRRSLDDSDGICLLCPTEGGCADV